MKQPTLLYYHIHDDVVAFSTTRHGGVSTGNYASFNINRYCGDADESIEENRRLLCHLLKIDDERLIMPHQVHLTKTVRIDEAFFACSEEERKEQLEGVDAIMTNLPDVCIGVSTADCIPVLVYDSRRKAAAAIHAGWRGTAKRIVQQTISDMIATYGSDPKDMKAQIGPGISLDSFEVGNEVYDAFANEGLNMELISKRQEKWHINLPECNRLQLIEAGIPSENINVADNCTMKQSDDFFSARRLGIQSGRIFTGISIIKSLLILLLTLFTACSCSGFLSSEPELTAEELRVQASQRIDSAFIQGTDSLAMQALHHQLTAEAWILVEDSTGLLLSAKNAHQRMNPASLTKMMTCILALEHGNMSDTIVITPDVFIEKDSRVRLGDSYLLGNIIKEMMMQSDNDAANAIAKHIGGNTPAFCQMMNEKAAYLGMDSTHFANPNGITNDSTFSTARDLLVLARYCMRDTAFAEIVSTAFLDIPLLDGRHLPSDNTNLLLRDYEGCIGIKTGYTRRAGACLASAATRNGKTAVLILLNSKTRTTRFTESAELLDHGFKICDLQRTFAD